MALMNGGKAVVEVLKTHGVDTVFGIISTHTMYIYDALYNETKNIRFVGGRHEHGVGSMADAYARVTGKPGILLTSGGPGAADSMGAMGEAYAASTPLLQFTANVEQHLLETGKGGLHDTKDQLGMFKAVTGWNARIDNLESLPDYFLEAFQRFKTGRPRPIELEMPTNLFPEQAEIELLPPREVNRIEPDQTLIEQAADALANAKRPIIWAGNGVMMADATAELRTLAESLGAAVVTAMTGKGAFPDDHPLSLGMGEFGRVQGVSSLSEFYPTSDLVLVVGSSMPYYRTVEAGLKLPENLIQIDIDPSEIGKSYPATIGIIGDAKTSLQQLSEALDTKHIEPKDSYQQDIDEARRQSYASSVGQYPNEIKTLEGIRSVLARDAVVSVDATVPAYRAHRCLPMYEPRTYIGPNHWVGLGFGFPGGIGAKVGVPDKQVAVITGDGGFQYNIQELGTAVQYDIAPVVMVFNDGAWGILKGLQRNLFDGRYFATDLRNPDFVKLAEAYGANGVRVRTRKDLLKQLQAGLDSDVITVIDVQMPDGFAAFT